MIIIRKTILSLVFAVGLAVWLSFLGVPQLFAQTQDSSNWKDFFDFLPAEKQTETGPVPDMDTESDGIREEDIAAPLPVLDVLRKKLVEVPPQQKKDFIDAGDFRDPFLLLRGSKKNTEKVLEPGVTVDGVQFNSYKESDLFIEKVYRDSRFQVEDVFGKPEHLDG
ncbi:MAG: hypothetical protein QF502_08390, partial [Nitrospinaceae bacterium]|nr:hypothetical protein [Nitrospinaceae bacterium]